jgi:hypothetical protein
MQTKDRQKMCSSCEGRIPFDAEICPYCANEQQSHAPSMNSSELHHQSLQDSLTALYSPPYAGKTSLPSEEKKEFQNRPKSQTLKEPMAEKRFNQASASFGIPTIPSEAAHEPQADEAKSSFLPIFLLSLAANLLTVGLLQLLFSENGFLRLEWNSSYWFVYCLAALPLFFFGFKKLS